MKKNIVIIALTAVLFLASCGENTPQKSWTENSLSGIAQNTQMVASPALMEANAPKVDETIGKVGAKLKENPVFRSCIARSTEMCGSEVVGRVSREGENSAACDIFEDSNLRSSCVLAITTELAKKSGDVAGCDSLQEGNKMNCVQQATIAKAIKEKNPRVCNTLKQKRENIPANSGAPSPVVAPSSYSHGDCIIQTIMVIDVATISANMCNDIEDEMIQKNCTNIAKSRIDLQKNTTILMPEPAVSVWEVSTPRVLRGSGTTNITRTTGTGIVDSKK